jgi:hypothetical protein
MQNNRLIILIICILTALNINAIRNCILSPKIKTAQAVVNQDWLSPPVMVLGSDDKLKISFDELSHDYHRFIYNIVHCEADWTPSEELFESDFLEGFNNNPIENYQNSINTNTLYTHYQVEIPNDRCQIKMSGNYILNVIDEDNDEKVLEIRFMVVEPLMKLGLEVTTNTDIDVNNRHQQISMELNYAGINITNHEEQIYTVVTQNSRDDNQKINIKPNMNTGRGLKWIHNRDFIFKAGNEYHKYEVLALSHPTMGIDKISWDGNNYQVSPFICEPRINYLYDQDANGAFYIRNSDNFENDITSDYVVVNYMLKSPKMPGGDIYIDGNWTESADKDNYLMLYDDNDKAYKATIVQKQGYYSYQFLQATGDGKYDIPETEGSYYQTENRYQAFVYYRAPGARTWRLVAYRQVLFNP